VVRPLLCREFQNPEDWGKVLSMLEDEFADIIKKARAGLGLSLAGAAQSSGIALSDIKELESGIRRPTRKEVADIAQTLRLNADKLTAIACDGWTPAAQNPSLHQDVTMVLGDIGGYAVKGYLLRDPATNEAAMIDTGYNPERMLQIIEEDRLKLVAICLTHGHQDHAGGLDAILPRHPVTVYLGEGDWHLLGWKPSAALRKFPADGEAIKVGAMTVQIIATPGHTPGGLCYRTEGSMFVGDTLFAGSIGRSNPSTLYATHLESVHRRLFTLPDETALFPGHGPATTAGEEKAHNPFG